MSRVPLRRVDQVYPQVELLVLKVLLSFDGRWLCDQDLPYRVPPLGFDCLIERSELITDAPTPLSLLSVQLTVK